jgi:hypothetical protein
LSSLFLINNHNFTQKSVYQNNKIKYIMTQIIKTKLSENINNISIKVKNYVANKVGF